MASATPDLHLPSQPQSITANWLVPNYTAWWQRHMCVNNLPRVALDSGVHCVLAGMNWMLSCFSCRSTVLDRQPLAVQLTCDGLMATFTKRCSKALMTRRQSRYDFYNWLWLLSWLLLNNYHCLPFIWYQCCANVRSFGPTAVFGD